MAELIAATTAAAQSSGFALSDGATATVMATGGALGRNEAIIIEISDGASGWERVGLDDDVMDNRQRVLQIFGPGTYRANKTVTAVAVGVYQV